MSQLEDLVYSAHEHGKRKELLEKVGEVRKENPTLPLEKIYELAYQDIMKT